MMKPLCAEEAMEALMAARLEARKEECPYGFRMKPVGTKWWTIEPLGVPYDAYLAFPLPLGLKHQVVLT